MSSDSSLTDDERLERAEIGVGQIAAFWCDRCGLIQPANRGGWDEYDAAQMGLEHITECPEARRVS